MSTVSTSVFGMLIGAGLYDSLQDRRVGDAFFKSDNTKYDQSIEDQMSLTLLLLLVPTMAFLIKSVCYSCQKAAFIKGLNNGTCREIVLAAVAQNGYALKYASEELRNDSTVQRQHQYLATRDGVTGRILLRLYSAEVFLYIAKQRLAFAKLLSRRLGKESNVPDQACSQDIIASIVNPGVLTRSLLVPGFEACVNFSMKSKPEGLSSDDNIQDFIYRLIRERCGQKGLVTEQLLPDRGDSGR